VNPQYQVKVGGEEGGEPVQLLISLDQIANHRLSMGMEKFPIGKQLLSFTLYLITFNCCELYKIITGFLIYKSHPDKRLSPSELRTQRWIGDSGLYRYLYYKPVSALTLPVYSVKTEANF
jgi:hypothetical protein